MVGFGNVQAQWPPYPRVWCGDMGRYFYYVDPIISIVMVMELLVGQLMSRQFVVW